MHNDATIAAWLPIQLSQFIGNFSQLYFFFPNTSDMCTHDPLPQGKFIRVLELSISPDSLQPVGKFHVEALDSIEKPFTAISYAWEDPTPASQLPIAGGRSLPLSHTLSCLIRSLGCRHNSIVLWIDALCINQKDLKERAQQVDLMGTVYSSAREVLLWLGEASLGSGLAFRAMKSYYGQVDSSNGRPPPINEIFGLLERPWFRRVWVIQEITLGENVTVSCGDDLLDFEAFQSCVISIWAASAEAWASFDTEQPSYQAFRCLNRLFDIRDRFRLHGPLDYETLLEAAFHCLASDHRDFVYGLRGIAAVESNEVPKPEYESSSVESVFIETATALLCRRESTDLLALSGTGARLVPSKLPTWVPDFRQNNFIEPLLLSSRAGWAAGGVAHIPPESAGASQLRIQLNMFDSIAITGIPFDFESVLSLQSALRTVIAWRESLPYEVDRRCWLEIVGTAFVMGLNINDEPVTVNDVAAFFGWLELLEASVHESDLISVRNNSYHKTMKVRCDGWQAFLTSCGFLGIGPPIIAVGDKVTLVPGCRVPLIMRNGSLDKGEAEQHSGKLAVEVIGWCFVNGLMFGVPESELEEIILE